MRSALLAGTAVVLLAGAVGPTQVAAGVAAPRPDQVAPELGAMAALGVAGEPGFHVLSGVEAIALDEAFSVGIGGGDLSVRARRWDGERWRVTNPPGGPVSEMYDVTAISPTDVWATGNAQGDAMANHWDGTGWTRVPTPPAEPGDDEFLRSVDGVATDNVWAVGYTRIGGGDLAPLIEHWDGKAWTRVPYKLPYGNTFGLLRGVTVVSATDVWAVGFTYPDNAPLLLHWDGKDWEPVTDIVTTHGESSVISLYAVDAVTTEDVWAVGEGLVPALLHWNGQVWTRIPSPTRDRDWLVDHLYGVTAIAADDVWAVGGFGDDYSPDRTRILHWDGNDWRRVASPNPGGANNALYAVSASGQDDAWAVGSFSKRGNNEFHLYAHWDGKAWTRVLPGGGQPKVTERVMPG